MIPDINMVRQKAIEREEAEAEEKARADEEQRIVRTTAIDHFVEVTSDRINKKLEQGIMPEEILLDTEVCKYIDEELHHQMTYNEGYNIIMCVMYQIRMKYEEAGYFVSTLPYKSKTGYEMDGYRCIIQF